MFYLILIVRKNISENISNKYYTYKHFHILNNGCNIYESIYFSPINYEQMNISNIKDHCSYYTKGVTNKILKKTSVSISKPLRIIINIVINLGIFPTVFKKTNVIPLFKSGNKNVSKNYRPVFNFNNIKNFRKMY